MKNAEPLMIEIYSNHKIIIDDGTFRNSLNLIKPKLKGAVYLKEFKFWRLKNV